MASQTYQRVAGLDFDSIVVGTPKQVQSFTVNNPTGAWLWFELANEYIPPYTLNWARTLTPTASRITVRWRAVGPDGTPSVFLGDPATIVLHDDGSAGSSNGQQFTPITRRRIIVGTMPVAASLTNMAFIGADTGRYIRSILVDNKSQNWLQLTGYGDTIPPNTVGWGKVLPDAPLTLTITAMAVGPDGSASIALGDPPQVTLLDDLSSGNVAGNLYDPIPHKRIVTTVAFGNLGVTAFIGVDAGRFVRGILADNPSGAWLTLTVGGAAYRIAPYQLRWVKRVDPAAANVTSLTFDATGPAGQISTRQGDQVTLTLLDQIPDVADTSFIQGFTPTTTVRAILVFINGAAIPVLSIAGVANKRIRILTITLHANITDAPVQLVLRDAGNEIIWTTIKPPQAYEYLSFPEGLDISVGGTFDILGYQVWASITLDALVTYQLI